jgi:hypothetical protein
MDKFFRGASPSGPRAQPLDMPEISEDEDVSLTGTAPDDWLPADNSYAIAVSEAQQWLQVTGLAIRRIRDGDDRRVSFGHVRGAGV